MPKRSNPFQKLIYSIQHHLADREATITESKLLTDVDGKGAEVDIVIEFQFSGVPFTMSVECTAKNRPATKEWVREMLGKHKNLATDKLVLVSKSGFAKGAVEIAKKEKIETYTIEEAESLDWIDFINKHKNLMLGSFKFEPKHLRVIYEKPPSENKKLNFSEHSVAYDETSNTQCPLNDYVESFIASSDVRVYLINRWLKIPKDNREKPFTLTATPQENKCVYIEDSEGIKYRMLHVIVEIKCINESTPLQLETGKFNETHFAYGTAENIFAEEKKSQKNKDNVTVTLVEEKGEPPKFLLTLPDNKQIFSASFLEDDELKRIDKKFRKDK